MEAFKAGAEGRRYVPRNEAVLYEKSEKFKNNHTLDEKASDIQIGRSVGAKTANYDVELPNGENVHLTEGTRVEQIRVIAGKGRERQIDEIDVLLDRFGGSPFEWRKMKGFGFIDYQGERYRVELHWYEEPTVGKLKWKVKPQADGSWFYED